MIYLSLLRGINISGKKKIIMKDLKALYASLGFTNVITYIQSGNVIFESDEDENKLIEKIEKAITQNYGFDVPVQIRNVTKFEDIIKCCPFSDLDLEEEGTRVMVTFLAEEASEEFIKKLMTYLHKPERLVIMGKEIYLHYPNGYEKSKLSNNFIENKLQVQVTTRNWNTVVKLFGIVTH